MQKLSLKVLLRFLSVYSSWNLVRRSEGYHLYFITKDSESTVLQFPERRGGKHLSGHRTRRRKRKPNVPLVRRTKMRSKTPPAEMRGGHEAQATGNGGISGNGGKDVFIFSPIFETVEEAVQVGVGPVENSLCDQQKRTTSFRSSFDSLAWDDFLPLKDNCCSDDDASYSTLENSTEFDSKESTPFLAEEMHSDFGILEIKNNKDPFNKTVRYEADKLLKDMLQLRKEIEEMQTAVPQESGEVKAPSEPAPQDESLLMDRLESMTAEVKKEMDEEQLKKKEEVTSPSKRMNIDDDTKIRNFFKSIVQKKDSSVKSPTTDSSENVTPTQEDNNLMQMPVEESTLTGVVVQKMNFDLKDDSIILSSPSKKRSKKKNEKAIRPTFNTDSLKRKSKKKKEEGCIDVPFCGYNSYSTSQKNAQHFFNSLDRRKKKKDVQTVLTAEEKIRAKEMLTSLLAVREKKGAKDNKVLESLIGIISLSSTNLNLPSAPTSNTVQFKELFDFEANFSESREVFQKLAMGGSSEQHTLQDLFPWSDKEGGKLNKVKCQYDNK